MPESRSTSPLVWIDCEMTGLDADTDQILSIACFITDADLNLLEPTGLELIIHHPRSTLDRMDEWCRTTHGKSGLSAAVVASHMSPSEAAESLLQYIKTYIPEPRTALLAGNTVHADQRFLRKLPYDPIVQHLHHRILDVSAIKEAARRWAPEELLRGTPQKEGLHEARADILESIEEAKYYRKAFFLGTK